jgi:hypothetical protein
LAAATAAAPISARRCGAHAGRGRLFQHLLVAALHRAVALEQVDAWPWLSPKTWISMWRGRVHIALDQHMVVPKLFLASRWQEASAASNSSAGRPGACPCRRRRRWP